MKKGLFLLLFAVCSQYLLFAQRGKVRPEWDIYQHQHISRSNIDSDLWSFLIIIGIIALFLLYCYIKGSSNRQKNKKQDKGDAKANKNSISHNNIRNKNDIYANYRIKIERTNNDENISEKANDLADIHLSTKVSDSDLLKSYEDEDGVLYSQDLKRLLRVPRYYEGDYIVRKGTRIICEGAFNILRNEVQTWNLLGLNYEIKSVLMPYGILKIGTNAFRGCAGLSSLDIPGSVLEIGRSAFRHCCSLTSLIIPKSVRTIGDNAFYGCEYLETVTFSNSDLIIGKNIFQRCKSLKKIFIPVGALSKFSKLLPECKAIVTEKAI